MTNAQKANEIANRYQYWDGRDERVAAEGIHAMAEWKDQQFKDAINSTLDYFDRGREAGFVSENSYNDMKYFASKIINELFKED